MPSEIFYKSPLSVFKQKICCLVISCSHQVEGKSCESQRLQISSVSLCNKAILNARDKAKEQICQLFFLH